MNKGVRMTVPFLLLFLIFGQSRDLQARRTSAARRDTDRLVTLLRASSFREADRFAATLLDDPALDAQTLAVCGLAVLKAGRIGEAETLFDKVISRSPDNPEAHLGLGRIDRIRNNPEAAMAHLRRAVPSDAFYGEAIHQLHRSAWDRGWVSDLFEVRRLAAERYGRESKPLPSWFINRHAQIRGLAGKRLFEMAGRFEHVTIPLVRNEDRRIRIRMVAMRLNGKGEYLFDIDSASADFLTISPLLAEEMGLPMTGSSTATGVGTETAAVRFSVLDRVELGGIMFRNVPVFVSDLHTFRGLKKGLVGAGLLKRFNVTIDAAAGVMELYPLDRPELLMAGIDPAAVAAKVPLYLFDATTVEASLDGAPKALYILDSAAAANLVDTSFFEDYIKPKLDPAAIVRHGIQGAQGAQQVNRVDGLSIGLGPLAFRGQAVHEYSMTTLNTITARYAAGLLGNPILWPYRVHLDFHGGRLILEQRRRS
ncbi:MAG: aspartyl protease family protein [Candidatus Aminicenantales bacterium]